MSLGVKTADTETNKSRFTRYFIRLLNLCLIIIGIYILCMHFPPNKSSIDIGYGIKLDTGGFVSLIVALVFVFFLMSIFDIDKSIISIFHGKNSKDNLTNIAIITLPIIGFISIWVTVRMIGKFIFDSLSTSWFNYSISNVFTLLAMILLTNLLFTLIKAFGKEIIDNKNGEIKTKIERDDDRISNLIVVAIQGVIISIITYIPKIDVNYLGAVGGGIGWASIIVGLISSLFILIILRQKINNKSH